MTNYFVSATWGSDSNNGLGPDASAVTNKPFKTIAKAIGSSGAAASGDTVYLATDIYREAVTVGITPVSTVSVIADYLNAQGFKNSSGVLLAGGEIRWTAYTTDDKSAPGTFACKLNGKNFLSFANIHFVGGSNASNGSCIDGATVASSHDITFTKCAFTSGSTLSGVVAVNLTGRVDNTSTYVFDGCIFGPAGSSTFNQLAFTFPSSSSADYDSVTSITNCAFIGDGAIGGINVISSGANSFRGGGVTTANCFFLNAQARVGGGLVSVVYPTVVRNCAFHYLAPGTNVVQAANAGQLVEDYNLLWTNAPRSAGITIGPFSQASGNYSQLFSYGQEFIWGGKQRQFGVPLSGSPILGFGNAVLVAGRAPTCADDATVGTISWTNPANASAPDATNAVATAIPTTTGVSHYLKATAYAGLSGIPSDATIKSIRVEALVSASAATSISCNSIKLVKAGAISGNDLASSNTTQFTTSLVAQSWGNSTDPLWGLALTPSDVQASNFGVVFSAKNTSGTGTRDCNVDFIRIIVAYTTVDGAGGVATDMLGRPRPAGGASTAYAVGPLERFDTGTREQTNTDGGTGSSLKLAGPSGQDFRIPVDAVSTTISVKFKTASYVGTNYPQAQLLAAADIGVSAETKTATGTSDSSFTTLTFTAISPTASGIVTVRLLNRTGDGSGIVYFDSLSAS